MSVWIYWSITDSQHLESMGGWWADTSQHSVGSLAMEPWEKIRELDCNEPVTTRSKEALRSPKFGDVSLHAEWCRV